MSDEATLAIEAVQTRDVAGSRRRLAIDLTTSYALSLSRVASWAAISMIVARRAGLDAMAVVALVRGTLNLLSYIPSAITPTLVRGYLSSSGTPNANVAPVEHTQGTIAYESRPVRAGRARQAGRDAIGLCAAFVLIVGGAYVANGNALQPPTATPTQSWAGNGLALGVVIATFLRTCGEPAAARLQVGGTLWVDNLALIFGEILTVSLIVKSPVHSFVEIVPFVGFAMAFGQMATLAIRFVVDPLRRIPLEFSPPLGFVLSATATVYLGQLADYLYGSTNQILIDRSLGRAALAAYVPCLQIDGALLLIVSGIGVALFPRIARDTRARAFAAIRRNYLVGTLVSLAMLAGASVAAWLLAPFAIRHWLGRPMPATLAILPLVLIHTVVGGTAGIGRAVLLGMGRFKAYTISALVGGVANVLLALLFVIGFGWGLRGVVFATIVAVVGRCAIWMPWYILRALRVPPISPKSGVPLRDT